MYIIDPGHYTWTSDDSSHYRRSDEYFSEWTMTFVYIIYVILFFLCVVRISVA